ncbi:response regulator [Bacillaceae bacterium S4-13-58]
MNLLLVDDEPFVLEQLKYLIHEWYPHWNLFGAVDVSLALNYAREHEIQLSILDIELPGKSGLELAAELKKVQPYTNIVMLSAHQDFEYARKSIQIGVDDYLTKPIIEKELKEMLSKYAQKLDRSEIVMSSIKYVQDHYHEKINLSVIANFIHVNSSYLSRKFHDEVGIPFSDYLLGFRIEMAKGMLIKSQAESISMIAEKCGFGSLHYFSSVFKKKTGFTPKEYKKVGHRNEKS